MSDNFHNNSNQQPMPNNVSNNIPHQQPVSNVASSSYPVSNDIPHQQPVSNVASSGDPISPDASNYNIPHNYSHSRGNNFNFNSQNVVYIITTTIPDIQNKY
ncbi:hypothetical protein RclHR1_00110010 [Rhizophagus clarus]|uniref:Uncharacterized protein n=1 Tax=Rhizophagus clarus TaxID=94130 RepID=A0A2Z6Q3E5_9GLOM|nr:hypothetical protein RclHR1_00110010 [Rhizophagus clarus]GES98015.1 hypothetical protein RCL_jg16280.t1 [Rhizophagus clarus]